MALTYIAGRCGAVITTEQVLAAAGESFSREWLKQQVLQFIHESEGDVAADENLMDYGLDSVQVMSLIAKWEKLGLKIQFEELAKEASLNAWWNLIEKKQAA